METWQKVLVGIIVIIGVFVVLSGLSSWTGYVSKPKCREIPLSYIVTDSKAHGKLKGLNWISEGYIEVENTDMGPGTFIVNCHFRTAYRDFYPTGRAYVEPGERKKAYCTADIKFGEDVSWSYTITPPTKTVCE